VDVPLAIALIEPDMFELEDHVDLGPRGIGVEASLVDRDAGHLADGQQPPWPVGEHLAMHLL
jgi:hypothetical protein